MSSRGFGFGRGRGRGRGGRGHVSHRRNLDASLNVAKFSSLLSEFVGNQNEPNNLDNVLKQFLMDLLVPMNIKFNLEKTDSCYYLTLTTDRNGANFIIPLVRQSNGAIWKITNDLEVILLVVPSNEFNNSYSAIDIEQHLKDDLYNVVALEDGTSINIYWDDVWRFATKNSRDCSAMEWRGYKYETIINECLAEYPKFQLENLDKSCVYTIGFHHPAHHPFGAPMKRAWLIQIYDKIHNHCCMSDTIGLDRQPSIAIAKYQRDTSKSAVGDLTDACALALQSYLSGEPALMGFILRSKDTTRTGAFSDIMIESSLFQTIKRCIYDLPFIKNKAVRSQIKSRFKNFDYVIVNAWLDFTKEPVFFKLFPQYIVYRDRFNSVVEKAIDKMIPAIADKKELESQIHVFRVATDDEAASNIAAEMLPIVRERISAVDRVVIRNLIVRPEYTDIYSDALF